MLKNYFKIAYRHILRNKLFSIIDIFGLSMAIGCSIVVFLFVDFWASMDSFHRNSDQIYLVENVINRDSQIRQRREASEMPVDKRSKDRLFRKGWTSPLFGGFFHRRQVFEKFLISDTWRKIFGIEKRSRFHDNLEFFDRLLRELYLLG